VFALALTGSLSSRVALQQAAALGGLVLTTDAIVIDDGEDDAKGEGESAA
jgi:hypothetical protein